MKFAISRTFFFLLLLLSFFAYPAPEAKAAGTIYYVDSSRPDDSGDGLTQGTAWKTLTKVNATTFMPGDTIRFKAGGVWTGQLYPKGSGVNGSPIIIESYGTGNKPIINGNGLAANPDATGGAAVYLYNQEYWEINNLEVTNSGGTAVKRYGVSVVAADYGTANHIYLKNLTVHNVNGINSDRKNGGISVQALGSTTTTKFNDVRIEDCIVYTVDRTGITLHSRWMNRGGMADSGPWNPWTNVLVKNNTVYDTGGDGILVRVAQGPRIEYNTARDANMRSNDNSGGIWPFNTDDAVVQFNEAYLTHTTMDGQGFDSDYVTNRTIIQYNYSHDNDGGFVLICNPGMGNFNNDTIVRYNISQNDKNQIFNVHGPVSNASIYNNTIYVRSGLSPKLLNYDDWGGYPNGTSFKNNIIYNLGSGIYDFTNSTNNTFDYNLFYGNHPTSEPADPHKLTSDPMFVSPGSGGIGRNSVAGYKLLQGSPAIDSGTTIANNGGLDYWGNTVPYNSVTDRGAYEGPGEVATQATVLFQDDFNDGNSTGWTTSGGTWSVITDGTTKVYNQSATTNEAISGAGSNWTDYTYSAKVKLLNPAANAGLMFRVTDNNNYYMFRLNNANQTVELYKKVGGTLNQIKSAALTNNINQWYTLKVIVSGNQITAYVDGVQKISSTNSVNELTSGSIGFRMYGSPASFDDVLVTTNTLFQDEFEAGNANNWTASSGTWSVVTDGSYVYSQTNTAGEAISTAGSGTWTNYTYSAKMKLLNLYANGGILFRYTDSNNFYTFRLNNSTGTIDLIKKVGGTLESVQSASFTSNINQWYTLKITVNGNQITGYVDGIPKISVTNTELTSGKIGLRTAGSSVNFDQVLITE
ncbi:family 16 glycoside hydrolase [Gorillibacterium sp. sgz5001074]|uniref:family 16 glycoside hydrolase n=1 Tax=Gorillibacterium sp. sgz5001074 TaxID=3446695 RepID=UPI003F665B12